MWFLILCVFIFVLLFVYHSLTKSYINPYQLIMVFGKKGCGKTTYLTKIAYQHLKSGWHVFCTDDIPNSYHIDSDDIGKYWFPQHSCILIDEVGMLWDNRDFKNFKPEVRDWFKYQRHNRCKVYLFSQTFDVDKKLRDLTDSMYLVERYFRIFSYGRKICKSIVLHKSTADAPSNIAEDLQFEPFLMFPFGTRTLTFLPAWVNLFDSHTRLSIPDLSDKYSMLSDLDYGDYDLSVVQLSSDDAEDWEEDTLHTIYLVPPRRVFLEFVNHLRMEILPSFWQNTIRWLTNIYSYIMCRAR